MNDLSGNHDAKIIPLSEEERQVNEAKICAFNAIKDWIQKVTGKYFLYPHDFRKSLADGILLCNLLNSLKPGSIKRINKISTAISGYDNLCKFLQCCEDDFGLSSQVLFTISDLEDLSEKFPDSYLDSEKRIERVLLCLFHLAKSVENQLTSIVLDGRPFSSLLKGRDIREMKKFKSHSMSEDSVFESYVPVMIQRQTPNYLANKAHETLEQTKQNQNIFHKVIENDDWQESLQNWREKRRQVLSSSVAEHINTDFDNCDSSELIKLKEKARKMKQLRDQIKDQNTHSNHDLTASQENASLPDIDDETKAMIERIKQKKLAEESKRQFSVSSPNSMSFASDSDLSYSLKIDKREKNPTSLSKKVDTEPVVPVDLLYVPVDGDNNKNHHITNEVCHKIVDIIRKDKTRTFTVKLSQRSKQDSEHLWGMDLIERSGMIVVSKVKIGSSSDVCEIRKDDEIVSINYVPVTNQSIDYVKSVFKRFSSILSPSDCITVSIRRLIIDLDDEEDDDEFISENISETLENNYFESSVKTEDEYEEDDDIHLHKNKFASDAVDSEKIQTINNLNKDFSGLEIIQNTLEEKIKKTNANPVENIYNSNTVQIPIIFKQSELLKNVPNNDTIKNTPLQFSVQDKIAKFESQNILNSAVTSLSLNASKNSLMDSSFKNTKYNHQSSCEGLYWNPDFSNSNPLGLTMSSISNSNNDLKTEPSNCVSAANQNMVIRSTPFVSMPLNSSTEVRGTLSSMELETAEENPDISNINVGHTWKRIPSSDNSSTSDDVSALNETIVLPQYSYNSRLANSNFQNQEKTADANDDNSHLINVQKDYSSILPRDKVPKSDPIDINVHLNNVSTGIQTNLTPNRTSTAYTTITTSFEKKYRRPYSSSTSKLSDDESYSFISSRLPEKDVDNQILSTSTESKQDLFHSKFPLQYQNNWNEISKDFTAISTIANESDDHRRLEKTLSLSAGSNISGSFYDNNKPVEIEVTVTPQLFPMRNKSLFSQVQNEKCLNNKTNDSVSLEPTFDEDENTLKSDYMNATHFDEVMSPNKDVDIISYTTAKVLLSSKKDEIDTPEIVKIVDSQLSQIPNSKIDEPLDKIKSESNLESYIDTDQSFSTAPAPTLFNGDQKLDNTMSLGISPSKSDNINSLKKEQTNSSKKSVSKISDGLSSRQSSSTKDLRVVERSNKNELLRDNKESASRSSSSKRKSYTPTQSQVTFSNVVQDITHSKSQSKSYSIDRAVKNIPLTTTSREKKKQKTKNKKSSQIEISTKCSSCSQPAGSEDLMVIEELKLHFHLRCFFCSECKTQLGDGKTDTDVRIRRSKLHCAACYDKKSSKPKIRNPFASRQHKSTTSSNQSKGGHGDGFNACIKACDSNNNFPFSSAIASSTPFVINNSSLPLNPSISLQ